MRAGPRLRQTSGFRHTWNTGKPLNDAAMAWPAEEKGIGSTSEKGASRNVCMLTCRRGICIGRRTAVVYMRGALAFVVSQHGFAFVSSEHSK